MTVQSQGANEIQAVAKRPRLRKVLAPARAAARAWSYLARVDADWHAKRGTAPFPLFRWLAGIGVLISTALGSSHGVGQWWAANAVVLIIAAVVTVGPEITRIEFGGMKMELLRETRDDVRALGTQLNQLQVQQAHAISQASVSNHFYERAETAAKVIKEAEEGEEAKRISAADVDWGLFMRPEGGRFFGPPLPRQPSVPEPESSPDAQAGSTVNE